MRVHGEKIIRRRDLGITDDYKKHMKEIREDFSGCCGYCGKNSFYLPYNYEIDHFVPRAIAPERTNDYQNLVFCCRKCNRVKGHRWPSGDKEIPNDGKTGFVDPGSGEYDLHLERNETGKIVPRTDLGQWICEELHFDVRRTDLFWSIEQLFQIKEQLEKLHEYDDLTSEELSFYFQINKQLPLIQRRLATMGE